jgi:hypothetical protein
MLLGIEAEEHPVQIIVLVTENEWATLPTGTG